LNVFETNAPLLITQHFYNQGLFNKGALIVNISSTLGSFDFISEKYVQYTSYSISKAALNMISKIQSVALKDVHTISVNPGWLKTDMEEKQHHLMLVLVFQELSRLLIHSNQNKMVPSFSLMVKNSSGRSVIDEFQYKNI